MSNDKTLTVTCKAFSGEGARKHKVMVSGDTVRVWDSVAGHYTTCHSLSAATQKRIVKLAAK